MKTQHPKVRPDSRTKRNWCGQYRDESGKKVFVLLGMRREVTKTEAQNKLDALVAPVNLFRAVQSPDGSTTFGQYTAGVYLPHKLKTWKSSTAGTTADRIKQHIVSGELANVKMKDITRLNLQAFLDARSHYAKTTIDKLKFDVHSILDLAVSDGAVTHNRVDGVLQVPKSAPAKVQRVMTAEQVSAALNVLSLRERLFVRLAIFAGMRPGEITALYWRDIKGATALVDDRVYRGKRDTTKTDKVRKVALSASVLADLNGWREFRRNADCPIFETERRNPWEPGKLMQWHIRPALAKINLGWVNFLVMRRTNATLGGASGADPKVMADNRGHGLGVSMDTYTQSTDQQKAEAVEKLEGLIQ